MIKKDNNFSLDCTKNLFDVVKIFDPINNTIVVGNKEKIVKTEQDICFKAHYRKKTIIEVEQVDGRTFLIIAKPLKNSGKSLVNLNIMDMTESQFTNKVSDETSEDLNRKIKILNELANTDELTGMYNRRYLNKKLEEDFLECTNNNIPISIAMIDIDKFKQINDNYNHITGDYVLKEVSAIIAEDIRKEWDWVGRFGGEEFILCFKNTDLESAVSLTERLRAKIENHKFNFNGETIKVTASFGVTSANKSENSVKSFINRADELLYKAKNTGRNKVISA